MKTSPITETDLALLRDRPTSPTSPTRPTATEEQLLALGAIIARNQAEILMGRGPDVLQARAVIAGVVAAAKTLLPPDQFTDAALQWEVDVPECLDLARATETETDQSIDV